MADLADVRSKRGLKYMDAEKGYIEAFRRFGLDLATAPSDQAIARLKALPAELCAQVVTFLDDWAVAGYEGTSMSPLALARGLDPNPERNRLRSFLEKKGLKEDADAIHSMAERNNLIESGPSSALLLASALERIENENEAIEVLRSAVVRYPCDLWVNSDLANRLRWARPAQTDDAIRYYSIVRALRPSTGTELADLLQTQNRDREAEGIRREVINSQPEDASNWASLIKLLKTRGKSEKAREIGDRWLASVREQIKRAPKDAVPHLKAAFVYDALNDRANEIAELKEGARLTQESSAAISHFLGHVLFLEGDLRGAASAYRQALRIDPADVSCHYDLAFTLCRFGDHVGEVQALREALRHKTLDTCCTQIGGVLICTVIFFRQKIINFTVGFLLTNKVINRWHAALRNQGMFPAQSSLAATR